MNSLNILLPLLAIGYVMVRRLAGEPLTSRRIAVLPLILTLVGASNVAGAAHHLSALDAAALAAEILLAVLAGVARGSTVRVYARDGHLWYRYTALTIAIWLVLLALRLGVGWAARSAGADAAVLSAALLLMLGLSLLGEGAVIGRRALATGVPFAPRSARRLARAGLENDRGAGVGRR
ncbi:hypothetical protein ACFFWC_11320 [Plantactinospora siamensis]|uniref:DUF1453 domain-containing protein n=1 Tax=Plantactinospora siamensis TaxID=555372 RepID=A0ABV6P1K5_9ACTN